MTGAPSSEPNYFSHPFFRFVSGRSATLALLLCVAALPVAHIAQLAIAASRNIVFWDEFDTALDLIIQLQNGASWSEILHRFFAVNNEHRMLTSRLLFASSYWLSGTVNFHVIGAIGNLFIVGACAVLIDAAQTAERRIRLGVLLAFLIFQLENFETFLWSGASVDHFQVVLLAVAAIVAVARGTRSSLFAGGLFALLATFTLAHGAVAWVIGALLLCHQRRWAHLACWCGLGALVLGAFSYGFIINPGHRIAEFSAAGVGRVAHYWLALLGGPLALGHTGVAPVLGLGLLMILGALGARGAATREPVFFAVALFGVGALGLIALGRTEVTGGQILSRYMILGLVVWSVAFFLTLEQWSPPARPYRLLLGCLPALGLFNIAANAKFAPLAHGYAEARDRAASRFTYHGEDGHGPVRLHPQKGHARALLQMAASRGVYQLPALCEPRLFPAALPNDRMVAHVDELKVNTHAVLLGGWAMIPGHRSRNGQIHVVLKAPGRNLIFTTLTLQRPDVARAYHEPRWRLSGFRFVISRDQLPADDYQIGLLIDGRRNPEYKMTDQWLRLTNPSTVAE